jgi:hypothetical protein
VLVFWRGSRNGSQGHVGIYIAESATSYYVMGGNQNDSVNIKAIPKSRLLAARRSDWNIGQPSGVKPYIVKSGLAGTTTSEA